MVAYLDTGAFDRLYRKVGCTSANIAELRKAVYGRGLAMPIGIHVLEDILQNRRASPQELVARVKLTLSLASIRRMVKPSSELIADDIRSYAASGQPARPLVSAEMQNVITQGIAELIESDGEEFSEEIDEALEQIGDERRRFAETIEDCRQLADLAAKALPVRASFGEFFEQAAPSIGERLAQRTRVPEAFRASGIAGLIALKSVRAAIGTVLSSSYERAIANNPPAADNSTDCLHVVAAAATAEILVTDEPRRRECVERIALDGLRATGLAEFIAAVNGSSA